MVHFPHSIWIANIIFFLYYLWCIYIFILILPLIFIFDNMNEEVRSVVHFVIIFFHSLLSELHFELDILFLGYYFMTLISYAFSFLHSHLLIIVLLYQCLLFLLLFLSLTDSMLLIFVSFMNINVVLLPMWIYEFLDRWFQCNLLSVLDRKWLIENVLPFL